VKKLLVVALLLGAVLVLAACTGGLATPEPAKIRFGETQCADCGMIINEPKFAASFAYEESAGRYKSLAFDDIGDMLAHMRKHPEIMPVGYWVHDYGTEEWIDAATAFFVESDQIRTPMGHGLAALADQGAAEKLAAEVGGKVFDWDKVRIEHAMAEHHH
jgi:copper chaperone NosL